MRKEHVIEIDPERCVGCGLCQRDCPAGNIRVEGKRAVVVSRDCILCGHCAAICPQAAVSITGFDEPAEEIGAPTMLDPETLGEALKTRRSVRQFTGRPVEPEAIARIIEAGRLTPTGGNAQGVSYLVLEEDGLERCEKAAVRFFRRLLPLARLASPAARRVAVDDHFFFKKAPAAVVVLCRSQVDGALAAANMALMAEANGLGVLYSGFFTMAANRSPALRKLLGMGRGERAAATLVLGHSAVAYRRTAQKEAAVVRRV